MKNSNFPGKDYFKKHPLKELSAARFAYSQLLMPEVEDIALQMIPELEAKGIPFPDNSAIKEQIRQEQDVKKLLRLVRNNIPMDAKKDLTAKLKEHEAEVLPELQRILLKAFNSSTIENITRFMVECEMNCADWIRTNYHDIRDPYARSMMCLVLAFRGDMTDVVFLMGQVDYFEKNYPDKSHEQAPLIALYELKARYSKQ